MFKTGTTASWRKAPGLSNIEVHGRPREQTGWQNDRAAVITDNIKASAAGTPAWFTVPAFTLYTWCWVIALLFVAFGRILHGIYNSWFDERIDMGHGLFVPIAAAYMAWAKRDILRAAPSSPSAWGLLFVVIGALQAVVGTAAQWIWVSRTAFLISLLGCLITLHGFRIVRELAYPLCVLVLMIAPPTFIYERITLPLQMLASRLGEVSLEAAGYSVLREGNILELVGERLAVEEACSGIRSLVALFFLCLIYCYFFVPRKSIRAILLLSAIPIAIVTNAGRIFATGVLGQYDRELAHGVLHPALGHASLISAAVLCVLLHRGIKRTWPNASRRHG